MMIKLSYADFKNLIDGMGPIKICFTSVTGNVARVALTNCSLPRALAVFEFTDPKPTIGDFKSEYQKSYEVSEIIP